MPPIDFVREQTYLAGIKSVHESDECLTHIARLRHPRDGVGNYYVKRYLDGALASKGLINEVCGHIVADAAGLPLPGDPLLIELPLERLSDAHPSRIETAGGGMVLAWATPDSGAKPLPKSGDEVERLLRGWKAIGTLIAFDSWVVVADRSVENLLTRGKREILVIDHGHLGGGVGWTADSLPIDDDRRHPLLSRLWVGSIPQEINQSIIVAAERHADLLAAVEGELIRWIDPLAADPRDRIALLDFLERRAKGGPDRMKSMLRLLA